MTLGEAKEAFGAENSKHSCRLPVKRVVVNGGRGNLGNLALVLVGFGLQVNFGALLGYRKSCIVWGFKEMFIRTLKFLWVYCSVRFVSDLDQLNPSTSFTGNTMVLSHVPFPYWLVRFSFYMYIYLLILLIASENIENKFAILFPKKKMNNLQYYFQTKWTICNIISGQNEQFATFAIT